MIAIKAADLQTRIGGVTFEYDGRDDVYEIFKVTDKFKTVVEEALPKLIYQYSEGLVQWVNVSKTEIIKSLKKLKI